MQHIKQIQVEILKMKTTVFEVINILIGMEAELILQTK